MVRRSGRFALAVLLTANASALTSKVPEIRGDDEVIVRGSLAQIEIERILKADKVDTETLGPKEVLERIATIPQGRAPQDFWQSYQRHRDAWQQLVRAMEDRASSDELSRAEARINFSYDEVERIELKYGARLP